MKPQNQCNLASALAIVLALAVPGAAPAATSAGVAGAAPAAAKAPMVESDEERLGVRIRWVRLSAAGFMVDLRYRVLDAAKATPLLDRMNRPYLLAANGARLGVPASPKIGALRSTNRGVIERDRDYSMLFGNPGQYLKPGRKVTLVVGDEKIENLTIE